MPQVTVLAPNGRRQKVSYTPNTAIIEIIQEVCDKHDCSASDHGLKFHRNVLDSTSTMRFCGVPANAQLELVEVANRRIESAVTLCIQLESGERLQGDCEPADSLLDAIVKIAPDSVLNMKNPVAVYMRREVIGREDLKNTSLKNLGLLGGRAIIRLMDKTLSELRNQANVSAPLSRPKRPSTEKENEPHSETAVAMEVDPTETTSDVVQNTEHHQTKDVHSIDAPITMEESSAIVRAEVHMVTDNADAKSPSNGTVGYQDQPAGSPCENVGGKRLCLDTERVTPDKGDNVAVLEKVILLGDRNAVAYNQDSALPMKEEDLPDDFFELSLAEVRGLAVEAKRRVDELENAPMLTAQQRKLAEDTDYLRKLHDYKSCVTRIRFPDRTVLQGCFKPLEKISCIHQFVREYLENPQLSFHLYTTPPKKILKEDSRLIDEGCVPSAILYFGCIETADLKHFLRNDVISKFSSLSAATLTANQAIRPEVIPKSNVSHHSANEPKPGPSGVGNSNQSAQASSKVPKWFKGVK